MLLIYGVYISWDLCSLNPFVPRVLCETVKDFVARVGKAYEKNTERSEESDAMAKKVLPHIYIPYIYIYIYTQYNQDVH